MKNKLNQVLIALLLFSAYSCWAVGGKGNLSNSEIAYFENTFFPILIKDHICTQVRGDCFDKYVFCNSSETLGCAVYGITDKKIIKELFFSMLNSGLNFSGIEFYSSKYHEKSFFEKPILQYIDRTGDK